jgi:hypothetical protein
MTGGRFPGGHRFAFTIMDDTDVATVANVGPVYQLLDELGFRTTKTVWPLACPEGSANFGSSETLEDPHYLAWVLKLAARGFEIAYHGATMESSTRERTAQGLVRFQELFGGPPRVFANHAYNQENLYWGSARLDDPVLRLLYARTNGRAEGYYQGHVPGSPWWWGDLAERNLTYMRNLTFANINLLQVNPSMPYRDPKRPLAPWWFSASDAEDVAEFNALLSPANQDRLEREGGVCIVATHLGKGFTQQNEVHKDFRRLLGELSRRPGWFVPVGELLDWMRRERTEEGLPRAEWRSMQWRWAWDLVARRRRSRARPG